MRESFIDKVYDTYLQDDFSYGIDNLNPIREIKPSNNMDIDAQIAQIYAALANRVENVKKTVAEIAGEEEEKIYNGNAGAETNNGADNTRQKKAIKQVGSTRDKLIAIPSLEDANDPLSLEIELMLLQMTLQSLGDGEGDTSPNTKPSNGRPPRVPDPLPFDCNCDDEVSEGSTRPVSNADGNLGSIGGSNPDKPDGGGNGGGNGGAGGSGGSSNSGKGNDNASVPTTSLNAISDAMTDVIAQADKASIKNEATMKQCAMAEIGFLKAILAVLKIVKMIKQMLDPILGILMEAVQLVQLAAQCWNNPTCIGTIVQRVMQTIIAILMGVIASLLAQLWSMLGLDCMTAQAQNIIDEIRSALAAVNGIVSELDPTSIVTEVGSICDTAVSAGVDTANSWKKIKDSASSQISQIGINSKEGAKTAIKNTLGLTDDDFENFMANPASRKRMLAVLKKTAPNQAAQIEALVEQVLNIQDMVKPIVNTLKNTGSGWTNMMSTFNKVKSL